MVRRRLIPFFCSGLLLVAIVIGSLGSVASALGSNLVANPSAETANGTLPANWSSDKYGKNTVSFIYDTTGHTGSRSLTTKMTGHTSGDAKWFFNPVSVTPSTSYTYSEWYKSSVKTDIDYVVTDANGTDSYYWLANPAASTSWKQVSYTFTVPATAKKLTIYHSIAKVGTLSIDDVNLATTDGTTTPPPPPPTAPTAPTVSVTAPAANTTVSGTTTITANASDAVAVTNVQFKIDGTNVGSPDTAAPYSYNWDTKTVANGTHTITAVATNGANLSTTSSGVTVTVNNTVVTPPAGKNLIANPSFETASGSAPANWNFDKWGTNTTTSGYLTTGHTGSRSVQVTSTAYTNGAAEWYYNHVPVSAGKTYQFTDWYKSTVDTEVDAEVTMSDGSTQYFWLGSVPAASDWTQYKATFQVPAGGVSMSVYHILAAKGSLTTDDYSLSEYTPVPFNRGIVSVTLDDGWANQYANARPVLNSLGLKSTYYIISGEMNDAPAYMTTTQVKQLYADGNEIGDHTVTHPDLTKLTTAKITAEMANSQTALQNLIGAPVTSFAYPYGAYNTSTINIGKTYFSSQRSVDRGLNTHDNLDVTKLKIFEVDATNTTAEVQQQINDAIAQKAWLILVYHEIATTPAEPDDAQYTIKPADFAAQMNYLKNSGVSVQTVKSALAEVQTQ
jgi:peptidoglycan/xylan/chitin deacetylase (PgdA/CDA1 family)